MNRAIVIGVSMLIGLALPAFDALGSSQAQTVRIEEPDYGKLYLPSEKKLYEDLFKVARGQGVLFIETTPPGAELRVEGKPAGRSPLMLENVASGFRRVEFVHPDARRAEGYVFIAPDEVSRLAVALPAAPTEGSLTVLADTPGAKVALDGEEMGVTPDTFRGLPVGVYAIRVSYDDFSWSGRVAVTAGETSVVKAVLGARDFVVAPEPKPEPPATPKPVPPPAPVTPPAPVAELEPEPPAAPPEPVAAPEPPKVEKPTTEATVEVDGRQIPAREFCGRYTGILMRYDEERATMDEIFAKCMDRAEKEHELFLWCAVRAKTRQDVLDCTTL